MRGGSALELCDSSYTKERVVDLVDHVGSSNSAAVEAASIETLISRLATCNFGELQVDVAIGVGIDRDMNDLAVACLALIVDFFFEVFDPVGTVLLEFSAREEIG